MSGPDSFALAAELYRQDRLAEAERICLVILQRQPSHFAASHLLGAIGLRTARPEVAVRWFSAAIDLRPEQAEPYYNRALARTALNRPEGALADYDRAIAVNPDYVAAHNNRGNLLRGLGRPEEALCGYDAAIARQPGHADAFNNRGAVLMDLERFDDAIASFEQAVALNPEDPAARRNLANALCDHARREAAQGRLDQAFARFDRAVAVSPEDAEGRRRRDLCQVALSLQQLSGGDYIRGWRNFEARWAAGFAISRRAMATPAWTGDDPIEGKTILVQAEQGFGDALQFCRYVPMLAARAKVILDVPRPLFRLLSGLRGIASIVTHDDPVPAHDAWVPMMSLPLAFRTTVGTIPTSIPYLHADAERSAAWRKRLSTLGGHKAGLVWAGAPHSDRPDEQPWAGSVDQRRSIALRQLGPLGLVSGLSLISLQKGEAAAQTRTPPEGMTLHDWADELEDFADTAALIEALDLVISVDTSVVHLAGALGKPVWVLNRYDQCWRWLSDRTDSPWYPTARLFRQHTPGDWAGVIRDVVPALHALLLSAPGGGEVG